MWDKYGEAAWDYDIEDNGLQKEGTTRDDYASYPDAPLRIFALVKLP